MEYFWAQYEDLPEAVGYGRFSPEHWGTLAVITALIICTVVFFRRLPEAHRRKILQVIPFVMLSLECCKDLFLLRTGHFGVGYLPLHLCSLGLFVFLLSACSRTGKWQLIFGEIAVVLILPGSIAALLFPDWAHLYPVWSFMNLYGFVWHGLLVLYPLLCLAQRQARPSFRHIRYVLLFLLCVVPPVYAFDRIMDCNYMFLNWPPKGTPLEWIASLTGSPFYLVGYAVFSIAVILLIYAVIESARSIRAKG